MKSSDKKICFKDWINLESMTGRNANSFASRAYSGVKTVAQNKHYSSAAVSKVAGEAYRAASAFFRQNK
eukprot:8310710-Pyramimonas_sp.AAC.1